MFHVVASYRANPAMMAPSKRNCRIAQRIARTPKRARGAHTFSLCSRNVTVWQVRSQHIQRRIVPPDPHRDLGPRARRSPPPPHACDLEQVTPQPGHPAQRSQDSLSSTGPHSRRAAATRWKHPPSQRADHADHNDQATQSSSRWVIHRPGPLKTAGVEVRSSSRTLTSTRNPDQHPVTHTHLRRALFTADP